MPQHDGFSSAAAHIPRLFLYICSLVGMMLYISQSCEQIWIKIWHYMNLSRWINALERLERTYLHCRRVPCWKSGIQMPRCLSLYFYLHKSSVSYLINSRWVFPTECGPTCGAGERSQQPATGDVEQFKPVLTWMWNIRCLCLLTSRVSPQNLHNWILYFYLWTKAQTSSNIEQREILDVVFLAARK